VKLQASPETDDDLMAARDFITADNEKAALDFLDTVFEAFDRLGENPEMGAKARFKHAALKKMRYFVLPPPFNRWIILYQTSGKGVDIRRVLYGNINWKDEPGRFF